MSDYRKCFKPDCMRKVTQASRYCCHACAIAAAETAAAYEIEPYRPGTHWLLVHSEGCEKRAAERGECPWAESIALAQN